MAKEHPEGNDPKRDAIVVAAAAVFARYGYRKTAMNDIIRAAGVSRGTLYKHFSTKGEVFRAVIHWEKREALRAVREAVACEKTARQKLKVMICTSLRVLDEKVNLYRLAVHSFSEVFPHWENEEEEIQERTREILEIIVDILEAGVASGEIAVDDVKRLAEVVLTSLRGVMFGAFFGAEVRPAEELADTLVDTLFDGVATARGKA